VGQADIAGDSRLLPRRHRLHGRDVQERVKMTFAKGAALKDRSGLFNSSLDSAMGDRKCKDRTLRGAGGHMYSGRLRECGLREGLGSGYSDGGRMIGLRLMKATPSAASSANALTRCFRDLPNRSIFQTRTASNRRRVASDMSRFSAGRQCEKMYVAKR
jgi:hypothetical protein